MAAKFSRHIVLTGHLVSYLDDKVAGGEYASASDMARAALRLLIERDKERAARAGSPEGKTPSALKQASQKRRAASA